MVAVTVEIVILIWFGEGICRVISQQVSIAAGVLGFCLFVVGLFLCVCVFWFGVFCLFGLFFVFWGVLGEFFCLVLGGFLGFSPHKIYSL